MPLNNLGKQPDCLLNADFSYLGHSIVEQQDIQLLDEDTDEDLAQSEIDDGELLGIDERIDLIEQVDNLSILHNPNHNIE
jgi:hypothetical protein